MTPLSFEWQWSIEYLIFMGLLYLALAIIGSGILYTLIKTWRQVRQGTGEDSLSPCISETEKPKE